jgi:hypothetical protein
MCEGVFIKRSLHQSPDSCNIVTDELYFNMVHPVELYKICESTSFNKHNNPFLE